MQEAVNGMGSYLANIQNGIATLVAILRPSRDYAVFPGAGNVGTSPATYTPDDGVSNFQLDCRKVDIYLYTSDLICSLSQDGHNFGDDIVLVGPGVYSFPFRGRKIRIKSRLASQPGNWQIIAWA